MPEHAVEEAKSEQAKAWGRYCRRTELMYLRHELHELRKADLPPDMIRGIEFAIDTLNKRLSRRYDD